LHNIKPLVHCIVLRCVTVVVRDENQLLLLVRLLYDHLPRHLLFLPVTEARVARSVDSLTRSLSRELMLSSERQKTPARRRQQSDADGRLMTDELSVAQLQATTDCHALKLVSLFC